MFIRTACLRLIFGVAWVDPGVAGDEPAASDGIPVLRDIPYREGPSKQWRLDLTAP